MTIEMLQILSLLYHSRLTMIQPMPDNENRNPTIVNLSIDDIAEALEKCTFDTRYILDLQDQEIIMLSEYLMSDEEIREVFDEIDEDETGRYVLFPIRTDFWNGYADMELFIDGIEDQQLRNNAYQAINGSGAFRRFRDFIREYPDLERQWYTWKDNRTHLRAKEWLEEEGLILIEKD